MVGPTLGAIPAGMIALSVSPSMLIWVVIITVIIQLAENNLLVPRIMSKAVGVNPFVSLLAIFAFSTLFGLAGALMAIPMAAIIQLILDRFVFIQPKPKKRWSRGVILRADCGTKQKSLPKILRVRHALQKLEQILR
jgi:predicted PurR-regulated permease PerM